MVRSNEHKMPRSGKPQGLTLAGPHAAAHTPFSSAEDLAARAASLVAFEAGAGAKPAPEAPGPPPAVSSLAALSPAAVSRATSSSPFRLKTEASDAAAPAAEVSALRSKPKKKTQP